MKRVSIYTDGACSGNPGPGGWAAILIYGEIERETSGFRANTTNNQMELLAAIEGLNRLKETCEVDLYSDSAYLINAFEAGWLNRWSKNGWKKADKQPVENQELWQKLLRLSQQHTIIWHKVKGHANNAYNNRCDQLAREAIKMNTGSKE